MLKIKLKRIGKKGYANYLITVNEARSKRDGKFIEKLGTYNPHQKAPLNINYQPKRLDYWLSKGAQPTNTVRRLLKIK